MKKLTANQLTRMAFLWAEDDRNHLAACWDEESPEHKEAKAQAQQLRAYRVKRWGKTSFETMVAEASSVSVFDLHLKDQQRAKVKTTARGPRAGAGKGKGAVSKPQP